MAETHMNTCKSCGKDYDATTRGRRNSTVNCPSCRGGGGGPKKASKAPYTIGPPQGDATCTAVVNAGAGRCGRPAIQTLTTSNGVYHECARHSY